MKKIYNLFSKIALILAVLLVSCEGVLDEQPRAVLTPDFFNTGAGLEAALTAAYATNRYYYASEGGFNLTVAGTDEYHYGQQVPNNVWTVYTSITADEGSMNDAWRRAYEGINTANGIIELGPQLPIEEQPDNLDQIIAEAKFIRANWYFVLVRTFGGVSLDLGSGFLAFNNAPSSDQVRESEDAVYEVIIQDLLDAIDPTTGLLSERPNPGIAGHAWRASALHLLSKVYLARGWKDGSASDYQAALTHALELINNRAQYGVDLLPNYVDVHVEGNEWSPEVLFTVEWNGNVQYNNILDHGNSLNNGSNFYFREFYVQDVPGMVRDVANGRPWIRYKPTPWMMDVAFADKVNDQRYAGSFQDTWYANTTAPGIDIGDTAQYHVPKHMQDAFANEAAALAWAESKPYVVTFPDYVTSTSWSGVSRNEQNKHFPSLSKFDRVARPVAGTETDPNVASSRPFIVYRFAETFLVAAEAALQMGDNAAAVGYINEIRNRAGALPIVEADLVGAHGDAIDFILDERTRELTGEQMRWFDLKRTRRLLERVHQSNGTAAPSIYNRQYNGGVPMAGSEFLGPNPAERDYLRPIPQESIDAQTSNYPQNPGFN